MTERELDGTIHDLFPFKTRTILRGVWQNGYKNYAFNIHNDTKFDTELETFTGEIRVYCETERPDDDLISDIMATLKHHELTVEEVSRKWREE